MKKDIDKYTKQYVSDYEFEAEMVKYRSSLVLTRLNSLSPKTILELGCGLDLQASKYYNAGGRWKSWTLVEPSPIFAENARSSKLPFFSVIQNYFEDINEGIPREPDLILCSGLLHEVPDANSLLSSIHIRMGRTSLVHINVPNANSLHRQLGHAMGLIENLNSLGDRNIQLQQKRVFDKESLITMVEDNGLKVIDFGGYLVKPFTHEQMKPLVKVLGNEVMEGLNILGQKNPHIASEIFVEAVKA